MSAVQALTAQPVLIGLDWGTTAMRAYLFDALGNVVDSRASSEGIMRLPQPGGFDAAFESACGAWLEASPGLPVIAAGMVGSAQGWREAPYVDVPADASALVAGIVDVTTARGVSVRIVPGVIERGDLPNVMRGEETQIVGALASDAIAANSRTLVGLPGTHAKWAVVRGERIESFHTFMTGELYAALREHTILGRTMLEPVEPDTQAFLRGVTVAKHAQRAGLLATIFSTRTLGLTGALSPEQQPDYLSGLLIGHELAGLAALLESRDAPLADEVPRLIGGAALCERYRLALAEFGCRRASVVEAAAENGLWRIATQAGFVPRSAAAPAS
ncbi:2-dehydro-3-deoxygalactonokinase [Trinickia dabaoshanensis]|uniref:2-dehydro-3-deoxygalactonokinase n=1 Tax=Trinickia dabaoshanensis TaxID=564714 RepID=A0A2N7W1D8_9BURK|nr:2-dehydro-3-deoxygalactonokinase [Trinickia dabaoshanensis]